MTSLDEEVTLLDEEVTSLDDEATLLNEEVTSLDEVTSFGQNSDAPQKPILKLSEDGNNSKSSVLR